MSRYGADNFTAASDQIAAAGIKVKIVTGTPLPSTMTQLAKGTLSAVVSFPYVEVGYAAVDALARKAAGVPVLQLPLIPAVGGHQGHGADGGVSVPGHSRRCPTVQGAVACQLSI